MTNKPTVHLNDWLRVTFDKPVGFRDIYWCRSFNEPVINEYVGNTEICPFCEFKFTDKDEHTFICHIEKGPAK